MMDPQLPIRLAKHAPAAVVQAPASAVADVLRSARKLLSGGWSEPLTLDADGRICGLYDEGAKRFCVHDAVYFYAGTFEAHVVAWSALAATLDPLHDTSLHEWLEQKGRALPEVLALFDRALLRVGAIARAERAAS